METHLTAHDKVEDVEDSGLHCSQKHMPFGAGLQTFFSQQLYFLKSLLSKDATLQGISLLPMGLTASEREPYCLVPRKRA